MFHRLHLERLIGDFIGNTVKTELEIETLGQYIPPYKTYKEDPENKLRNRIGALSKKQTFKISCLSIG